MKSLGEPRRVVEIRARLACLQADDAGRWGLMTADEMVVHLREAFRLALGERSAEGVRLPVPPTAAKYLSLYTPMRWPQNIQTVAELKRGRVPEPVDFARDLAGVSAALERFLAARELRTARPFFGAMRPKDWMRWGYLHTDHHLRQFGR